MSAAVGPSRETCVGAVSWSRFGLDSDVESIAGMLVGSRLAARLRHSEADERRERRTLKLVAVTFPVLAGYVTVEGIRDLVAREEPEGSRWVWCCWRRRIVVMPLARAKLRIAHQLDRRVRARQAKPVEQRSVGLR